MRMNETMGISGLKICPDCGNLGPRLINRCADCETKHRAADKLRQERPAQADKIRQRRANGFGPEWDL